MAPGVAFAADSQVQCGTPAQPAVYSTVVTPGTPAVSHTEYEWSLVTEVVEKQWHRYVVDSAAQPDVYTTVHHDAVYETVVIVPGTAAYDEDKLVKAAYDEPVVTPAYDEPVVTPAYDDPPKLVTAAYDEPVMTSPAVVRTEWKFVSKNGKVRWDEDPNWNSNNNDSSGGWVAANESRTTEISPAVYTIVHHDAVYTTVHHDAVTTMVHHDAVTTMVHHDAVYETIHHDAVPDVTEQQLVKAAYDEDVLVTPATPEEGHWEETWSVESPGEDWTATGYTRTVEGETQLVWAAESPGEGWTATGAYRSVEDTPAVPESSTEVLVTEAIPAGPACPQPPSTGGGDGGTVVPVPASPASPVPTVAKPAAVNATTELAFTGSDPTLMWLGLGFLLTGIGVSAGYRKVAQQR